MANFTCVCLFVDSYSPDHTYCYPYDECWLNNGETCYDSDSEMWFGRDLKRLSQRCKRISRNSKKLRKAVTNINKLQQKLDSTGDDTVVKEKPRTSPRLFKPEAPPRKAYKQDVLPVSTSDIRDVGPMKSTYHDQHRYVHIYYYFSVIIVLNNKENYGIQKIVPRRQPCNSM